MHTFSKSLIQKTIHYFKDNYNHLIDEETAEEYLSQMAGYFEAYVQVLSSKQNTQDTTDEEAPHKSEQA